MKFYICSVCGNLVEKIVDGGTTPSCCGKPMRELFPASTDGAVEKHVPVYDVIPCRDEDDGLNFLDVELGDESFDEDSGGLNKTDDMADLNEDDALDDCCNVSLVVVDVGETPHPMLSYHHIMWILLETDRGVYRKDLKPGDAPEACFMIEDGEKLLNIYAYCDLHGLWLTKCE